MGFLKDFCFITPLAEWSKGLFINFKCSNEDLDDFFANEAYDYQKQLIGKTYYFALKENPRSIVCAFTIANSSVSVKNLPNRGKKIKENIPREKHIGNYPAVLIGRLGVSSDYKRQHAGTELLNFIKSWFVNPNNKTGCRFVTVDAYNSPDVLSFYEKNGFCYLFSSLKQEQEKTKNNNLKTRSMYFDLIELFGPWAEIQSAIIP
ncbi:hypothetical protein Barb4_00770 [Bacteroidales bacterium Barb4]|nr:hypothetical protein Barb4_00770 [Bacteroidales bacterium Barb4]